MLNDDDDDTSTHPNISIFAQHVDDVPVGNTTGYVVPELLYESEIDGALLNHSEHRIPEKSIVSLVPRLRNLDMHAILCVKDVSEVKKYAMLEPDYIAIEPPELIGTGRAISKERPELVTDSVNALKDAGCKNTKILCGAGIVSGNDVTKAIELGSDGVLVASGVIKAKKPSKVIKEMTSALIKAKIKFR